MKNVGLRFAVLCFACVASCRLGLSEIENARSASPSGVILVSASIEEQPATLLLDTGAEKSCLDTAFLAKLRSRQLSTAWIRQPYATTHANLVPLSDMEVQGSHLRNLEVLSSDLSQMSKGVGVPIDGVLGDDLLRYFTVRIDFFSGSVLFSMDGSMPLRETAIPLQAVSDLYFVPSIVHGTPISLLLDTGTNASIVSAGAWERITKHWHPQAMISGVRSTSGSEDAKFVLIPSINIGHLSAGSSALRVQSVTTDGLFSDAGFDGLLGNDVLRNYVVTLDLKHSRMYLEKDLRSQPDFYRFSTIGIQFERDEAGIFTIMAVWAPSTAQSAGLKIGDHILAVNHTDTQRMSLNDLSRQIHGHPGTEILLVIDSNGHRREVSVKTSCLLCPSQNSFNSLRSSR